MLQWWLQSHSEFIFNAIQDLSDLKVKTVNSRCLEILISLKIELISRDFLLLSPETVAKA